MDLFFILYYSSNNLKSLTTWQWRHLVVIPVSFGGGIVCALLTVIIFIPYLRKRSARNEVEREDAIEAQAESERIEKNAVDSPEESDEAKVQDAEESPEPKSSNMLVSSLNWMADNTYRQDLKTQSFHENKRSQTIWEDADYFNPQVEFLFSYLQVFTACLSSFAHGANDVSNAIAPISAVLDIYSTGKFNSKAPVQKWLLALGGFGIGLGFAVFGYRIIKSVGYKLTMITPSRGFCIELASAFTVSLASFLSIPVSTTQCLIGATVGVGLASGGRDGLNFWFLFRTCCSWVGLFLIASTFNAGFFSFTAFSPSLLPPSVMTNGTAH
jgi:sodium-dependent phosphate transporter